MFGVQQLQNLAQAGALLDGLVAAVDDTCARIDTGLSGDEAAELFAAAAAMGRQLELVQCLSAERVERSKVWQRDGAKASPVAHLRALSGQSSAWTAHRLNTGRALVDDLPATRAAWRRGELGLAEAGIIRRAVEDLDDELTGLMEKSLADLAPLASQANLARAADAIRTQAAPEEAADKALRDFHGQRLSLSKTLDGRWRLDAWLDSEHGALLEKALEHFLPEPTPDPVTGAPASAGLRRVLGLSEMARQAMTHDGQCATGTGLVKPTVVVTIPHDDLVHQLGIGDLEGRGTMPAAAVRRLACDASILPLQYDSDGHPLDLGRTARLASAAQRLTLIHRDGGCVFPGCEARPSWCDAHHLTHWVVGGPTDLANLVLLCRFHHHALHEGGWTHTGTPGRDLTFHPPQRLVRRGGRARDHRPPRPGPDRGAGGARR